jgi:DNA-binding GntR family transcriptional regulator
MMARMFGVSRNTIATAYDELAAEGLIESRAGSGVIVSGRASGPMGGFDLRRIMHEAQYPSRTLMVTDPDDTVLYLTFPPD